MNYNQYKLFKEKKNKTYTSEWFKVKVDKAETETEDVYQLDFRITNANIDYGQEIVNPDGVKFVAHPKVLYAHDDKIPAVGKPINIKLVDGEWIAKVDFDKNDPFAMLLYHKYLNGYMTDCSVGFSTDFDTIEFDSENEILIHNDILVFEFSLCNIGMNNQAEVLLSLEECELVTKSTNIPKHIKEDFEAIKQSKKMEFEKRLKSIEDSIQALLKKEATPETKAEDTAPTIEEVMTKLDEINASVTTLADRVTALEDATKAKEEEVKPEEDVPVDETTDEEKTFRIELRKQLEIENGIYNN